MSSAAEVHAARISQRAAEEARREPAAVPMSPRSRLESFRAEQNLRQQGTGNSEEASAAAAAAGAEVGEGVAGVMPAAGAVGEGDVAQRPARAQVVGAGRSACGTFGGSSSKSDMCRKLTLEES